MGERIDAFRQTREDLRQTRQLQDYVAPNAHDALINFYVPTVENFRKIHQFRDQIFDLPALRGNVQNMASAIQTNKQDILSTLNFARDTNSNLTVLRDFVAQLNNRVEDARKKAQSAFD